MSSVYKSAYTDLDGTVSFGGGGGSRGGRKERRDNRQPLTDAQRNQNRKVACGMGATASAALAAAPHPVAKGAGIVGASVVGYLCTGD